MTLIDRLTCHRGQLSYQSIGYLACHGQLAVALELLDRRLRVGADISGRLQLPIAILRERTLHVRGTPRRDDEIAEWIMMRDRRVRRRLLDDRSTRGRDGLRRMRRVNRVLCAD